ncbi:MAG: tetratricopeptide repeat protein [Myxococcales bacterium]|nr:tetratricopeptide repeat protein [Myxococcales bacterium]MDD9968402.1 tetratricopeptide repeat protein [Myxococcales bacterium]
MRPGLEPEDDLKKLEESLGPAVDRIVANSRKLARVHLSNRNYPAALRELTTVHSFVSDDPEVTEELGEVHEIVGNQEQAEHFYRETITLLQDRNVLQEHAAVLLKLVALLTRRQGDGREARLREADGLVARARTLLGNTPQVALHAARLFAGRGNYELAYHEYQHVLRASAEAGLLLEVGDFLRDFGHHDLAHEHYQRIQRPPDAVREATQRIFELLVLRERRQLGLDVRRERIPSAVLSLLERARQAAASSHPKRALPLIEQALEQAPVFPDAHAVKARVLRKLDDDVGAELAYLRALSIEGGRPDWLADLAELYERQSPARRAEAALLLGRALKLRPDWAELHLRLARVERLRGDLPRSLAHVKRFLTQRREGSEHVEAIRLRDELMKLLGPRTRATAAVVPDPLEADPSQRALQTARVHLERGETDAALTVLRSLTRTARSVEVRLYEAQVLNASGRPAEAAQVLERLVQLHRRPEVIRLLASTLVRAGRVQEGRRWWSEAEREGDPEAAFELARMDMVRPEGTWGLLSDVAQMLPLLHAHRRLDGSIVAGGDDGLKRRAMALRGQVTARLSIAVGTVAFIAALLTLLPMWWLRRRDGGSDLYELVARYPESGPDVQRIMAAIRHEVLKHNTLMLAGLSSALAYGQPVGDHGTHLRQALFGDGTGQGAFDRLETYLGQLRRLGRGHGLRLNLERRDPVTRVLIRGMRVLSRLRTRLDRLDKLRPAARRRVLERLRRANTLLNEQGYSELRSLLDHIRVYTIDEPELLAIFDRVRREPAVAALNVAPLAIDADGQLPCTVDVPQAAFEDILANLIRNAVQSEARQKEVTGGDQAGQITVGLSVRIERDPVTALSRVNFLVHDRARQTLTQEELHGQYVEQGLGLTADLVSRYQGSLDVRSEPPGRHSGWVKSVVLTVPHVEEASIDEFS